MRTYVAWTVAAMLAFTTLAAAQTPRPVSQQEIDRLKRQIDEDMQSSVEAIVDFHRETGDLNNRLDAFRYGARLNLKFGPSSVLQLTGTRANYIPLSDSFREHGLNFTAALQSSVSESMQVRLEAGASRFSTDARSINALGSVTYNVSDDSRIYVIGTRSHVEESLLSTTGIRPVAGPFAGLLVGNVMENRFVAGGSTRLDRGIDIFGEGGAGTRAGSNVPSNFFKTGSGGAGYSVVARPDEEPLSLLRVAYELNYFGFEEDRSGFGGVSLLTRGGVPIAPSRIGSDGMSPNPTAVGAGVGGYFSPENFVGNIVRAEAKGSTSDRLSYSLSGFLGSQKYTGVSGRLAKGLNATVTVGLSERVSLPVSYVFDNFGPFTQQLFYARLAVRF